MADASKWGHGQLPDELEPPRIRRRVAFDRLQLIGVPLLTLLPLIAILGLFGETRDRVQAEGAALAIAVEYPTRFRYKTIHPIRISVTSRTDAVIDTVRVVFDVAYLSRFSNLAFTPAADGVYSVPLTDVRPGETREVHVEIQAEDYWRHTGWIAATAGGPDTVRVSVATTVFP